MNRVISTENTARIIALVLEECFGKEVKFRVEFFDPTSSITINWYAGPSRDVVKKILSVFRRSTKTIRHFIDHKPVYFDVEFVHVLKNSPVEDIRAALIKAETLYGYEPGTFSSIRYTNCSLGKVYPKWLTAEESPMSLQELTTTLLSKKGSVGAPKESKNLKRIQVLGIIEDKKAA